VGLEQGHNSIGVMRIMLKLLAPVFCSQSAASKYEHLLAIKLC